MQMKGVREASVNNAHDTLRIVYDPNLVTFSRLESAAKRIGADIAAQVDHATFALDGLDNPDGAHDIERSLGTMDGILWAGVNFVAAQAHVEFKRDCVTLDQIARRIARHGAHPRLLDETTAHAAELAGTDETPPPIRRYGLLGIAALLGLCGLLATYMSVPTQSIFYLAAILLGGWGTLRAALTSLRTRIVDRNVLLLPVVVGALGLKAWGEAAAVVVLYGIGSALQTACLERLRRALRTLTSLVPQTARLRRESGEVTVAVALVRLGEILSVRPGERIPLDGVVLRGSSAVMEAPLTGAGLPVEKGPDAVVFAGTLNGSGTLEIRVIKAARDTLLAHIIHGLEEAQAQRSPAEKRIDRFVSLYTPFVFWLAILVAFVPALPVLGGFGGPYSPVWFHRGLFLLLIAGSGGLALAAPAAVTAALATASRRGILIKGGAYLEAFGGLKAVVYEKTGTLTQGRPVVVDVVPLTDMTCSRILSLAAALEHDSAHPLARAICAEAAHRSLANGNTVVEREEIPGSGVCATVDGAFMLIGSPRLFQSRHISLPRSAEEALAEAEKTGKTGVLLGGQGGLYGLILMTDTPRPESAAVIEELSRLGIRYQTLMTGDGVGVAKQMALAVGLKQAEGGLLPDEKHKSIRLLQRQYGRTAMIGDGIDDAPALAAAEVGVALGAAGSDTALEAADVALMRDDLTALPFLVRLSRRASAVRQQNTALAMLVKAGLLGAALTTVMPLWWAVLGEAGAALLVIANALRLADLSPLRAARSAEASVEKKPQPAQTSVPQRLPQLQEAAEEPLLELVFVHDPTVDEQPVAGYAYPCWNRFTVPFTGEPIRFGRRSAASSLPLLIEDAGMSRVHGEFRLEGKRPVVVDLHSTNGIRRNGTSVGALIAVGEPVPLHFGDFLCIGRNTRIEIRPPGTNSSADAPVRAVNPARAEAGNGPEATAGGNGHSKAVVQNRREKDPEGKLPDKSGTATGN